MKDFITLFKKDVPTLGYMQKLKEEHGETGWTKEKLASVGITLPSRIPVNKMKAEEADQPQYDMYIEKGMYWEAAFHLAFVCELLSESPVDPTFREARNSRCKDIYSRGERARRKKKNEQTEIPYSWITKELIERVIDEDITIIASPARDNLGHEFELPTHAKQISLSKEDATRLLNAIENYSSELEEKSTNPYYEPVRRYSILDYQQPSFSQIEDALIDYIDRTNFKLRIITNEEE